MQAAHWTAVHSLFGVRSFERHSLCWLRKITVWDRPKEKYMRLRLRRCHRILYTLLPAALAPMAHGQTTTPDCTVAPYNVPAGYPTAATTAVQDQAHLMCLQGLLFPGPNSTPPVPLTRSGDANKPPNAWPTSLTTPETSNWTDALSHTIVRWGWGQWTTYDDSDSGGQANVLCNGAAGCTVAAQVGTSTGGALSGFGDYGPAGARPYPTGNAPLGDNYSVCTSSGCLAPYTYTPIDNFTMKDGVTKITTPTDWWVKRRPELLDLVQKELYGYLWPQSVWPTITWTISAVNTGTEPGTISCQTNTTTCTQGTIADGNTYAYREKTYTGTFSLANYPASAPALRNLPVLTMDCRFPANAQTKVPTFVAIGGATTATGHPFQYTAPLGYAACSYTQTLLQADAGGAATSSYLSGLINGGNWRGITDPGTLEAWAWGISRTIDEFALDPDPLGPDPDKIAVEGHSRNGKATLVTAALDDRIVAALPSGGGAAGTSFLRRNYGESIESIVGNGEYYWVDGYLMNYAGARCQKNPDYGPAGCTPAYMPRKVQDLDVDSPQVMALIAPRAVMTNGGTAGAYPGYGDEWQDPRGMFLSGSLSSPVWTLLGWPGQIIPAGTPFTVNPTPYNSGESIGGTPPFDTAFISGTVGYRRHVQGHTDVPEWPVFVAFASKYLSDVRPVITSGQTFALPATSSTVGTVQGTPGGGGSLTNWQIKGGTGAYIFAIDPSSGAITIPDRTKLNGNTSFTLILMASDGILPAHDTTITINPTIVNGTVQLLTTTNISKQADGSYQATVTVTNSGTGTAQNVVLASATFSGTTGTPAPQALISIAPGGYAVTTMAIPASVGTSGSRIVEQLSGTYTGGTFGGSLRTTLP